MGSQSCKSHNAETFTGAIFISESNIGEAASTASLPEVPVGIKDGDSGPVLQEIMGLDKGDCAASGDISCEKVEYDDWDIRHYVQFHVRTKFMRSSISCVLVSLGAKNIRSL